ncbi:MAG: hypothetical protein ABJN36_14900 [Cyclobacteriaceae bacterium]
MKKILILTLIIITFVMGDALAQKKKNKGPKEITEKEMNWKGGYNQKKFNKAPKKIYISKFNVYFHVIASATAKTSGGRTIGGGSVRAATSTTMTVAVDGVDVPDFQKITDDAYNRFVSDLEAQGFEFISTEEAANAEYYADWTMKDGGEVNYANIPGYVSVTPTGTKYMIKKETKKGREKSTFVDKTMILSGELDDVLIAEVTLAFPAIDMDADGGVYAATSKVKANVNYRMASAYSADGLTNVYANNMVKFVSGKGPGLTADAYYMASLKEPVGSDKAVFKDTEFKERNTGSTSPMYYGIVFKDNETSTATHTTTADHDLYVSESQRLINEFFDLTLADFFSYYK